MTENASANALLVWVKNPNAHTQLSILQLEHNAEIPILLGKLDPALLALLKADVLSLDTKKSELWSSRLAGAIKEEYKYSPNRDLWSFIINTMYVNYSAKFNFHTGKRPYLTDMWVNFQKKHEFNPVHNHTGAVSFVIWVQVPYDLAEEAKISPSGTANVTSHFQFVYRQLKEHVATHDLPISKDWEGVICMFPSYLMHTVYPFYTSDDHRISIAGNIFVLGANYSVDPNEDPDKFIRAWEQKDNY